MTYLESFVNKLVEETNQTDPNTEEKSKRTLALCIGVMNGAFMMLDAKKKNGIDVSKNEENLKEQVKNLHKYYEEKNYIGLIKANRMIFKWIINAFEGSAPEEVKSLFEAMRVTNEIFSDGLQALEEMPDFSMQQFNQMMMLIERGHRILITDILSLLNRKIRSEEEKDMEVKLINDIRGQLNMALKFVTSFGFEDKSYQKEMINKCNELLQKLKV